MKTSLRLIPDLETALLRRGVDHRSDELETCGHCHRHPLIGERVHTYPSGTVLCELCRAVAQEKPSSSRLVHGPEFGHTMKIIDQRPAAGPAPATADHRAGGSGGQASLPHRSRSS
jgi:hypothetical protein